MSSLQEELEKRSAAEYAERGRKWLEHITPAINKRFPEIPLCDATWKLIVEACDSDPLAVSVEALELLMDDSRPGNLRSQIVPTVARDQKQALINEIAGLLQHRSPGDLRNEITRLQYFSLANLVLRRDSIIFAQENANKSVDKLRSEVRSQRQGFRQFEEMPPEYVKYGSSDSEPWTFGLLNRMSIGEAKRIIRRYGADAVNVACERSRAKGLK
jgi:hypothetical protein